MNRNYVHFNENQSDFYVANQEANYMRTPQVVTLKNSSTCVNVPQQQDIFNNPYRSKVGNNGKFQSNIPVRYVNSVPKVSIPSTPETTQWMPQTIENGTRNGREIERNFYPTQIRETEHYVNRPSTSIVRNPNPYPEIQVLYITNEKNNVEVSLENEYHQNQINNANASNIPPNINNEKLKTNLKRSHSPDLIESSEAKRFANSRETRFLTGNIEKIIHWHKNKSNIYFYLYEVIAPCIMIRDGNTTNSKILLLRDDTGPVLQVVYYKLDLQFPKGVRVKSYVRCVGRMIGNNRLLAMSIRTISTEAKMYLQRSTFISDHSFNRTMNKIKSDHDMKKMH